MKWLTVFRQRLSVSLVLCSLALVPNTAALAQSPDGEPDVIITENSDDQINSSYEERGDVAPGESNSMDTGKNYIFLPVVQNVNDKNVAAAAPSAAWYNVFYDELCSFPSGWTTYDYNGTGHIWVGRTIDGWCTAQPSAYVLKENTQFSRYFSLVGALDARAIIRFKMNTETNYDRLQIEYTCNSGSTWYGSPHVFTGNRGWSTAFISLSSCRGASSVQIRISFISDRSFIPTGAIAPVIDYVQVQKYL